MAEKRVAAKTGKCRRRSAPAYGVAEVQVPRWVKGVVDRAQDLPIGMRADPKAADIAIGRQSEAVAEVSACLAPARMIDKLLQRSAA